MNKDYFYASDDSFTGDVNLNIEPINKEPMTEESSSNFFESWCNLSVNIVSLVSGEFAYDANNNQQSNNIINILERECVVINIGKTVRSGYCTYPIYKVTQKFHAWCRDR